MPLVHDSEGDNTLDSPKKALAASLAAYVLWGLLPLFWKALSAVSPLLLLSSRIVFSLVLVWGILVVKGKGAWPRILRNARARNALCVSALLIGLNWGVYIWSVNTGRTVEASLGYYMNPLVNVFLGLLFFKERLKSLQWAAVASAAIGVLLMAILSGKAPWVSLFLAFSFALYGLVKKTVQLDSMIALGAETLLLFPLALGFLVFSQVFGRGAFNSSIVRTILLILSGAVTALPLYWFAGAAKRLPLSLLGFIQLVSPSLQLALAVFVFKEPFPVNRLIAFVFIWLALILYTLSYVKPKKRF